MRFRRKHRYLFLTICVVCGLTCVLNYHYKLYSINIDKSYIEDSSCFSIMTFNIDASDSTAFTENKQMKIMELFLKEHPDILCMQELTFENLKRIKPQLDSIYGPCDSLKANDQLWRLRFYSSFPLRNFKRYYCDGNIDTLDFGSFEISEYKNLQKQMPVMSAEFEVQPGRWITVFSGQLRSSAYSTARRSMSRDAHWLSGLSLYKHNYSIGKCLRDYEANNIRRFVDEVLSEDRPVIVAGDLNDWCGSDCLETLMNAGETSDGLKDAWWEKGNGFGFTYFGWNLRLRLDHILYSKGIELQEVRVVESELSDHKPLMAVFNFR